MADKGAGEQGNRSGYMILMLFTWQNQIFEGRKTFSSALTMAILLHDRKSVYRLPLDEIVLGCWMAQAKGSPYAKGINR